MQKNSGDLENLKAYESDEVGIQASPMKLVSRTMIRTYLKERQIIALRVGHVLKVRIVEIVLQILLPVHLLLLFPTRILRIILHLIRIRAAAWEEDKMKTQHLSILRRYAESGSQ
jgi:hypothetical protein